MVNVGNRAGDRPNKCHFHFTHVCFMLIYGLKTYTFFGMLGDMSIVHSHVDFGRTRVMFAVIEQIYLNDCLDCRAPCDFAELHNNSHFCAK